MSSEDKESLLRGGCPTGTPGTDSRYRLTRGPLGASPLSFKPTLVTSSVSELNLLSGFSLPLAVNWVEDGVMLSRPGGKGAVRSQGLVLLLYTLAMGLALGRGLC